MFLKISIFVTLRIILLLTFFLCGKRVSVTTGHGQFKYNYWQSILPAILVYTLVEGLRYGRGVDYSNYLLAYQTPNMVNTEKWGVAFEYLYGFLHYVDCPELLIFCVFSLITIAFFSLFMMHFREYATFMFPLFLFETLMQSENLVRQYISVGLIMLALVYCIKKDSLKMIVAFLLAFLFHKASIIVAPFLFVGYYWKKKGSKTILPNNLVLLLLLAVYMLPLFIQFNYLDDKLLGSIFKKDSMLSEYSSYSNASIFERDLEEHSLFAQIKDWILWGLLLILGYNIKNKYPSLSIVYVFYFVGSVFYHVLTDGTIFRLNLYFMTTWYVLASVVIYDYLKNRRQYSLFSHVLFYVYIIIMLQSYLPVLVVPSMLGCDFVWDV